MAMFVSGNRPLAKITPTSPEFQESDILWNLPLVAELGIDRAATMDKVRKLLSPLLEAVEWSL